MVGIAFAALLGACLMFERTNIFCVNLPAAPSHKHLHKCLHSIARCALRAKVDLALDEILA